MTRADVVVMDCETGELLLSVSRQRVDDPALILWSSAVTYDRWLDLFRWK